MANLELTYDDLSYSLRVSGEFDQTSREVARGELSQGYEDVRALGVYLAGVLKAEGRREPGRMLFPRFQLSFKDNEKLSQEKRRILLGLVEQASEPARTVPDCDRVCARRSRLYILQRVRAFQHSAVS